MYEFATELANAGATATRAGAVAAGGARQYRSDGRLCAGQCRSDVSGRVLLSAERGPYLRHRRLAHPDMETYRGKWSHLDPDMSPCREGGRRGSRQIQAEIQCWG